MALGKGIIGTLQLAATLVFAIPVAMLGVDFLLRGRLLAGGGFLLIAVLMVAVEEYVTKPSDVPATAAETAAERAAEAVASDDEES
jgi:hypothetical protein